MGFYAGHEAPYKNKRLTLGKVKAMDERSEWSSEEAELFQDDNVLADRREPSDGGAEGYLVEDRQPVSGAPAGSGASGQDKPGFVRELYDWIDAIVVTLIVVVILFTLVFRIVGVQGHSMMQTVHEGDRVIISNMFYTPAAGDIVVISRNYSNDEKQIDTRENEPIIKRVIATAGQEVDIDFEAGEVFVDGQKLEEAYVNTPTNLRYDIAFPQTVPEGCVFVMGDNRNNSLDSRSSTIGMVDVRYVLGHAVFRVLPFGSFGGLK